MSSKSMIVSLIAIVLAAVCGFFAYKHLDLYYNHQEAVSVTRQDIASGTYYSPHILIKDIYPYAGMVYTQMEDPADSSKNYVSNIVFPLHVTDPSTNEGDALPPAKVFFDNSVQLSTEEFEDYTLPSGPLSVEGFIKDSKRRLTQQDVGIFQTMGLTIDPDHIIIEEIDAGGWQQQRNKGFLLVAAMLVCLGLALFSSAVVGMTNSRK